MSNKVEREVNLTKMEKPAFLTLTGAPANQTGFKILRDASGAETKVPHVKRTRAKRSDTLLAITFEDGISAEAAADIAKEYGLEGYEVKTSEDGKVSIRRTDAAEDATTMTIKIGNGRTAEILQPFAIQRGVSVVSVDFAKDYYETDVEAKAWLTTNGIDFDETRVQNGDLAIRAVRQDIEEGTETRQIKVDDGVVFTVIRSDTTDVPAGYMAGVVEAAYGQWGWGQLDFAASMADIEFCNAVEEGTYRLRSVIDNIIFYSYLPLQLRKELVVNATTQFAEFVGALIEGLPAQVIAVTRSSFEKEKLMSDTKAVQAAPAASAGATGSGAPAAGDATPITREDVAGMIATAVTESISGLSKQLADVTAELAKRTDPAATATAAAAAPAAGGAPEVKVDPTVEALQAVMRSVEAISTTVKAVGDRVEKMESTTIVRGDQGDTKQTAKRADDVFAGIFGGSGAAKSE